MANKATHKKRSISQKKRRSPIIEYLEPRIMLSADLPGMDALTHEPDDLYKVDVDQVLADADAFFALVSGDDADPADATADSQGEASLDALDEPLTAAEPSETLRQELVIVDPSVPDYETLLAGMQLIGSEEAELRIVILDPQRSGIEQVSETLSSQSGLDAIHLITHGRDGAIQIGGDTLDRARLQSEPEAFIKWGGALTADGDILIYGCDVAATAEGEALIDALAQATGADIAASVDLTGHKSLGGDWELEYQTEVIDSVFALSEKFQGEWGGTLNVIPTLWDYHHDIDLASTTPLSNYPIKIELTEGVDGFSHTNTLANGDDIRFFDSAWNELSYWIQAWNPAGTSVIWVEIADAGTTNIDLYYGNAEVTAGSDPNATFLFFDDFADGTTGTSPAGWTAVGGATSGTHPSVEDDGGNLIFSDGANSGGPVVSTGSWSDVVVSQDFRTINPGDPINHAGLIAHYQDANNMVYGGIVNASVAQIWYKTTASGSFVKIGGDWDISTFNIDDANWHNQELRLYGDSVELYVDGTLVGSADLAASGAPSSGATGFWSQYSNYEAYRDNHTVRSYDGSMGDIATTWVDEGFTLEENSANGTVVGSMLAADADGDTLIYSITGGNTDNSFAIDSNGQITVNNSLALDFETTPSFTLIIQVDDGNGGIDTDAVTITMKDVNEAPVVSDGPDSANLAETDAALASSGSLTVTDVDTTDVVTASVDDLVVSGTSDRLDPAAPSDATLLAMLSVSPSTILDSTQNSATLSWNFNSGAEAFDYLAAGETLILIYTIKVTDDDGTPLSDTETVTITITGTNDDVVITSDGGGATAAVSIDENVVLATTVTADDLDTNDVLTFSIVGGVDAGFFSIDSLTGKLTFGVAPDFEAPADGNADNVYEVTVQVTDGTLTDSQVISVTVTNVNDNDPTITSSDGGATAVVSVNENLAGPIVNVNATDADGNSLIYSIVGGADAARFTIDPSSGLLSFVVSPNFEAPTDVGGDNTYEVTVQASDGTRTDTQTVTVTVNDINDAPVLDNAGDMTMTTVLENHIDNGGDRISDIIASAGGDRITDDDAGTTEGIAVVAVDDTSGTWQYSLNNGTNWLDFGAVSELNAVVLSASDLVRFSPNSNAAGTSSFSFRAWDGSDGKTSGTNAVNVSTNGGATAYSSTIETAQVNLTALDIRMLFTTKGDVTDAGTPNLQNWTSGTILSLVDPYLQFEDGDASTLSDGTVAALVNFDNFAADNNVSISALHYVEAPVTVGIGGIELKKGDILFVTSKAETLTSTNALSFGASDIIAYRPDAPGSYSSGTFVHVLDNPSSDDVTGISLVEKDIWVGDAFLEAGSLLFTQGGDKGNNIYQFIADTAGPGTTTGTVSTLIDAASISMGNGASNKAIGVMLVTDDLSVNGAFVPAGSIITSLSSNDTSVGDNNASIRRDQFFYLTVNATGGGTTSADATVLYEGSDIGLDGVGTEKFASLTFMVEKPVSNLDPNIVTSVTPVTYFENDGPTLIDSMAMVTDGDSANFEGGFLGVRFAGTGTINDRLAIDSQGFGAGQIGIVGSQVFYSNTLIGSFTGGTDGSDPLTISFTSGATASAVQNLVRSITYENVSDDPDIAARVVKFQLTDGDGGTSNLATKTINLVSINDAPRGADGAITVIEDTPYIFSTEDFGFSDPEGDGFLAVTISTSPAEGELTRNGVAVSAGESITVGDINAGLLRYTPAANDTGAAADSLTFQVQDDGGRANGGDDDDDSPNTITIDIAPVRDLVAQDDVFATDEDTVLVESVATNDGTTSGGVLSYALDADAINGAVVLNADGSFTYTPNANYHGPDSFSYTVTDADSGESDTRTVHITLHPLDDAPVLGGANTGSISEDADPDLDGLLEVGGALTINDPDAGESSFQPATGIGVYGSLTIDAAGNWTYAADNTEAVIQQLDVGESLTDVLTVATADGTTHDITITINGAEDAPVITGTTTGAVAEDGASSASGTLSISDVDASDNPVFFPDEASRLGDNGCGDFMLTGGTWDYVLNNAHPDVQGLDIGETLTDSHTFVASDGSIQVVTITIAGAEDAPVVTGDLIGSVAEDGTVTTGGTLSISDVDRNDNPVSFGNRSALPGDQGLGRFGVSAAGWTYTLENALVAVQALDAGETLTDSYTFVASDGSTATATVTIGGAEDASVIGGTMRGEVFESQVLSASGTLTISDVDASDNPVNFPDQRPTPGDNGYGNFSLSGDTWTYQLDNGHPAVSGLRAGEVLEDRHTFMASDGSMQMVMVRINGAIEIDEVSPPPTSPMPPVEVVPTPPSPEPGEVDDVVDESAPTGPSGVLGAGDVSPSLIGDLDMGIEIDLPRVPVSEDVLASVLGSRDANHLAALADKPSPATARTFLQELASFWKDETNGFDDSPLDGRQGKAFWAGLDRMLADLDRDVQEVERQHKLTAEVAAGIGVSLTAGFVSWALRAGSIVASFLAAMPTWRTFDPMPVLARDEEDKRRVREADEAETEKSKSEIDAEAKVDAMFDR